MATTGTVHVEDAVTAALPRRCGILSVTPLLRELVSRSAAFPMQYDQDGMAARVMALPLEEMALAQPGGVHRRVGTAHGRHSAYLVPAGHPRTGMRVGCWRRQLHPPGHASLDGRGARVQDVGAIWLPLHEKIDTSPYHVPRTLLLNQQSIPDGQTTSTIVRRPAPRLPRHG